MNLTQTIPGGFTSTTEQGIGAIGTNAGTITPSYALTSAAGTTLSARLMPAANWTAGAVTILFNASLMVD